MPMVGNDRGDQNYDAVTATNPNMGLLTPGEVSQLKNVFEVLFSSDTSYIQANADVSPIAHAGLNLNNPIGQVVTIPITSSPGSPSVGATSAPDDIQGKGSIL